MPGSAPGATPTPTTTGATPTAATPPDNPSDDNSVAALVNDAPISEYDLRQRILLFVATSGLQATPEVMTKLRGQVLTQLETEQLQIQEARRKNITVSPTDVDKSIDRITNDNHLTKDQLTDMLKKGGVDMSTLRAQIAVQIAWQKAVQDEFQDRVNIKPEDIDAEMARLNEGRDKPHFLVSVIFLAVDNPELDAKVLKDAQDILTQLKSGAQFQTVARQFSQSPTAAAGGDMGWCTRASCRPNSTRRCRRWSRAPSRTRSAPPAAITSWACASGRKAWARTSPIRPRSSRWGR